MSEFIQPPPVKPPPVPAHTPGVPHQSAGLSKGMLIFLTALITAVVTSICWILGGVVFYQAWTAEPPPFHITIEAPEIMELGDQEAMVVTIANESEKQITLSHIDMMDSLLDGFEVVSIEPKPSSKDNLFGIYSYYSKRKLKPEESVTFTFTLKATEIGYWNSSIDACNPMQNYVSEWVEIEVVEKGGIAKMTEEAEAEEEDVNSNPESDQPE